MFAHHCNNLMYINNYINLLRMRSVHWLKISLENDEVRIPRLVFQVSLVYI